MLSLRNRLAALFFLTTVFAVAVVYLYVTPQLQTSLREAKQSSLADSAADLSEPILDAVRSGVPRADLEETVANVADRAGARVSLLAVSPDPQSERRTSTLVDSSTGQELTRADLEVAERAVALGSPVTDAEAGADGRLIQVAVPLTIDGMITRAVLFTAQAEDVESQVSLIRRQILIAGGIALALALVIGVLVARAITQRVRSIEQVAERVAAGDFSARFPTDAKDELGQLAHALDGMQRQLAELDSARKRFIATASHELRTPIFSVSGFLELLEDEDMDSETRRSFLRQVREQVDRLGKLATDLLDLSRLEAGSLELRPERCDLGLLAQVVTSEFVPALAAHDSRLELRLGRSIRAECDPERVGQVLRILIDNALTHTPSGTDLVVTASRSDSSVRLAVRDSGHGIEAQSLDRVFEPFYTSYSAQGSGLGLTIARELTERMGGSLLVDSMPGAHTTFTLELPMTPPETRGPSPGGPNSVTSPRVRTP
ncbi:MAG TPA: HAMP domain-containing sensor histidine kinase [Solirubrobacteraceae bacterium]|nr:HAMP domain-containing sensor histidine kinase [Solirubrobacteraceae bacterium]